MLQAMQILVFTCKLKPGLQVWQILFPLQNKQPDNVQRTHPFPWALTVRPVEQVWQYPSVLHVRQLGIEQKGTQVFPLSWKVDIQLEQPPLEQTAQPVIPQLTTQPPLTIDWLAGQPHVLPLSINGELQPQVMLVEGMVELLELIVVNGAEHILQTLATVHNAHPMILHWTQVPLVRLNPVAHCKQVLFTPHIKQLELQLLAQTPVELTV